MGYEREVDAALRWMERTDPIALEHFGSKPDLKPDGTPVTAGDRAVEELLRAALADEFPDDGVLGEEEGSSPGRSGRRWIIDPIDGTKNYARGVPVFGTLVALEDDGRLVVGVVSAPALGSRWWGARGGGAFRDGNAIRVSAASSLKEAHVCSGGLDWAESGSGDGERLRRLLAKTARHRGFGDFWGHMLVAQGSMEAMVEFAPLAMWDIAAPRLIVEEAGGRWTGVDGSEELTSGPAVSSNGVLHDEVLAILSTE